MSTAIGKQERLLKIILGPHVSEKASVVADKNRQYVFKVVADATKPEIKHAVEYLFNVEVKSVQVCNQKGNKKRFGQMTGRRSGVRKAYVRLQEGHELDFMNRE
jgi:large subunit ribosomal protein L23